MSRPSDRVLRSCSSLEGEARPRPPAQDGSVTATEPKPLSGDEISKLLALADEADSLELKVTVPEASQRSALTALDIDPLDAQIRQVFFFDTPDLLLNRHGVVVRARRSQGRPDDTVVKLRPVVPHELPDHLRKLSEFGVEVDALPGGYVCSASFKGTLGQIEVREAAARKRPLRKLFSKGQRSFFSENAPGGVDIDDLAVLGPIHVLKLKFSPADLARRVVAEMWLYPDGSRILELSTKCAPAEGFQVAAEIKGFLSNHGIDITGEQQTKTATALRFFSDELSS